ncbi:MAG: hypothetical protein J0H98_06400 [Solirubrobacterales bacterium]|nr:hypothetical protein [Solirubrobacterales bacterium]
MPLESFKDHWDRALSHAKADPSRFSLFLNEEAEPEHGEKAHWFPPHLKIEMLDSPILNSKVLDALEDPASLTKHRVLTYAPVGDASEAVFAGRLRHEIRHGEQYDALGNQILMLGDLTDRVLRLRVGGLANSAPYYSLQPLELDANAASAQFLRESYGEFVDQILESDDGPLARSNTLPGDLRKLPAKCVAFLYLFREEAMSNESPAKEIAIDAILGSIAPELNLIWNELEANS